MCLGLKLSMQLFNIIQSPEKRWPKHSANGCEVLTTGIHLGLSEPLVPQNLEVSIISPKFIPKKHPKYTGSERGLGNR